MMIETPLEALERGAEGVASLQDLLRVAPDRLPATRSIVLDASGVSPAAVYEVLRPAPYRWLLESTLPGPPLGRYSFLTGEPLLLLWHRAGRTYLAEPRSPATLRWEGNPFALVQALAGRYRAAASAPTPFPAGLAGYLGYNLRRWIEHTPPGPPDDVGLPDCLLGLYNSTLTIDHAGGRAIATGPAGGEELASWRAALERARAVEPAGRPPRRALAPEEIGRSLPPERYMAAARRVLWHIERGDIYQANLTQRFDLPYDDDPWPLYLRLRESNPAPFAAYLAWPGAAVVSASPERFLRVDGREVVTRPIKGTRPRGRTPEEDRRLREELARSEKDRAENIMIVDLLRNDIGRVCEIGSVKVPELLVVETYATVHHLVSTVAGRLAPGRDMVDLLRACWPGGSITGAPKIRAMEIIAALEPVDRGVYCGSAGYLSFEGRMDTSIVIRTVAVANGRAYVNAGGGIVADSDPGAEYQETIDKAAALLRALGADPAALDTPAGVGSSPGE